MSKSTKKNENQNPCLREEVAQYIELNGWERYDHQSGNTSFLKGDKQVVIRHDNIDFLLHHEEDTGERGAAFSLYMSFTGISALSLFNFQLLLHISGFISLGSFKALVEREGIERSIPQHQLIEL